MYKRQVLVNVSPYSEPAEQAIRGDLMNAFAAFKVEERGREDSRP